MTTPSEDTGDAAFQAREAGFRFGQNMMAAQRALSRVSVPGPGSNTGDSLYVAQSLYYSALAQLDALSMLATILATAGVVPDDPQT